MDISVLLSSNHSREKIEHIVDLINSRNSLGYSYEIVVCSPHEIIKPNVKKIINTTKQGSVEGYNSCYSNSVGKYIISITDHLIPPDNFFTFVQLMNDKLESHKIKITSLTSGNRAACALSNQFTFAAKYAQINQDMPGIICRFPCGERESFEKYLDGVFFNTSFIHHYCDNWLGMYLSLKDKPSIEISEICYDNIPHNFNSTYDVHDLNVIIKLLDKYKEDPTISYNHQINV